MRSQLTAAALTLLALSAPVPAQWFDYPTKGIPRTPDGKANLNAPAPKTPDGKPDLSGVWLGDQWSPAGRRPNPPGGGRGGGGRGGGAPELLPWAQKVFEERRANSLRDDPEARCMPQGVPKASTLPYPFEIVNAGNKTLILFEMYSLRRQIFTDGRELPKEYAQPSWMGYSIGKWDGDEFVVTTAGVNDQVWNIDLAGHPHSDALRITERFRRVDFGHMDVQVTIDDSKTYVSPWNMPMMRYTLLPDTDLFEFVCEQNIDPQHMVGK
jgi:hypothetical protein